MASEIESLKAEIERLSQRIAVLEISRDTGADDGGGGSGDAGGANESQVIPQQKLRAFDVICDGRETDPWLVYLPDGCCKYGDFTPDVIDPSPDATTHIADLQDDTKNGGIYAHIYLELDDDSESESSTDQKVVGFPLLSIDTTPTQTPSEENIKVINVKIATITDGAVSQNISSALILGGSGGGETYTPDPSPFQFTTVSSEDPETHEQTLVGQISNCNFYWDGVLKTLSDFTPPATCTVYLCCTQAAPSSSGEAEWQFSIATSPAQATSGGRVVNYKLYDIASNKVTMDYRTTFLEFNSPHKVSHFVVSKNSEATPKVTISTTSGNASIELKPENEQGRLYLTTNGSQAYLRVETIPTRYASIFENGANAGASFIHDGKTIDFRTSELHHGSSMGIHTLRVKDINGTIINEYDVLSTGDIEIIKAQGTVLKDISLQYTNYQLQMTKTKVDLATGQETTEGPSTVFTTELHSAQS